MGFFVVVLAIISVGLGISDGNYEAAAWAAIAAIWAGRYFFERERS